MRHVVVEVQCNRATCGRCAFLSGVFVVRPGGGWYCELFNANLQHKGKAALRCRVCLEAEIVGAQVVKRGGK
jgi:hypothetical protein